MSTSRFLDCFRGAAIVFLLGLIPVALGQPAQRAVSLRDMVQLVETGQLDAAERILRANLKLAGERPAIDYLMGVVLMRRFKLSEARMYLERAVSRRADQVNWLYALAMAHAMDGGCQQAIAWLDRASRVAPDDPRLPYDRARCRQEGGDLQGAADELEALERLAPEYPGAAALRGRILYLLDQEAPARKALQAAAANSDEDVDSRVLLGRLLDGAGEIAQAEAVYRSVLAQIPEHPVATYALAGLLLRDGRSQEGQALMLAFAAGADRRETIENRRQFLALNPSESAVRKQLVRLLLADGDTAGAVQEARLIVAHDFADVEALRLLAEAHARRGELQESRQYRSQADARASSEGGR